MNILPTAVEELIENKLAALRRKYQKHNFVLVGSAPHSLFSAQHLLGICIAELLDNAAKHSLPGTTVITRLRPEEGKLYLAVSDDGPGMQSSQLAELFNAFTIVEDYMTKTSGGLGLGLSLVRSASRLLDIEITLNSEHGKGTECELCIPLQAVMEDTA